MRSTITVNNLLSNIPNNGNHSDSKEPLLPPEYRINIKKKTLATEEIKDCIDILKKGRRNAFISVWAMRISIITTAATGIWICIKNYFQTEADVTAAAIAEEISQRPAKAAFANQFNNTYFHDNNNEYHPCRYYNPESLPMMIARSRSDCCNSPDLDFWRYAPCAQIDYGWCVPPCYNIVSGYCSIVPTVSAPQGYLNGLIAASASSGFFIIKELYNAIFEALGRDFAIFFCSMSRLERCFISAADMKKIREIATKYGVNLNDRDVRGMLRNFEIYNKRFARKIAFFSGGHSRLGEESSLYHHFIRSELYDPNLARHILEFSGDNVPELKDLAEESISIPTKKP